MNEPKDMKEIVAQAMAFLGSKRSPAKTEAARRNASMPPKEGKKPRGRPAKQQI